MLIRDATLVDGRRRDVRIEGERIAAVERRLSDDGESVIDADGKLLLPGMIDTHVHFRQPGFPDKETWASGSRAAAAGGVTTVVDQPNTEPPTINGERVAEKAALAADSLVDFGINGGVTPDWRPDELLAEPLFALGEVFLADSTGEMGIDADLFADAVQQATARGIPVTVHAEDADRFEASARERDDADAWSAFRTPEAECVAIERACEVGREAGAQLHIAHASTPAGIDRAAETGMTCEVTPHHLLLSRDDLDDLGTFGRMNPPLRSEERREGVFERVADGVVDIVATDHAPHSRADKDSSIWDAPSGVPGVETALPLLLAEARDGQLSYERIRDLTAANPAAVFDLPRKGRVETGKDADLALFDPDASHEIRGERLHSKAGWTPFEGWAGVFPEWTMVRGEMVYERDGSEALRGSDNRAAKPRDPERFGSARGRNVRSLE